MKKLTLALAVSGMLILGLSACGGDDTDAFCDQAAEVEEAGSALQSVGTDDIDGAKAALSDANEKVQEVADSAPSEISDDVNTVADFIDQLSGDLENVDNPQDFITLAQKLQGQVGDIQEASDNVDAYIADNC